MTFKRLAAVAALVTLVLIVAGCNETFRTIVIPQVSGGGDPEASKVAVVVADNGASADGNATTFNLAGDTNIGQVTVGRVPTFAIPFTGTLRTAVANSGDSSLTLYTTRSASGTQPTIVTIPAGSAPSSLFLSGSSTIFAAFTGHDSVGVIDLLNTVFRTEVPLAAGSHPVFVTGPTDLNKVYVANQGNGTVSVVDSATNTKLTDIVVGSQPTWLAVSPTTAKTVPITAAQIYVVNQGSGTVSVIDTGSDTVVKTISVGAGPTFATFDPRLLRVYVANTAGGTVSIINTDPLSPNLYAVTTVAVGTSPSQIAALADGSRAYVTNAGSGTVSVINTTGNNVVKTIPVGTGPMAIAASPDSLKVIVGNNGSNNVSLIRTSDDTVTVTLPVPGKPVYIYATT